MTSHMPVAFEDFKKPETEANPRDSYCFREVFTNEKQFKEKNFNVLKWIGIQKLCTHQHSGFEIFVRNEVRKIVLHGGVREK